MSKKNLEKAILDIIQKPTLANLATINKKKKPWTRYVMMIADNEMNIRIATRLDSRKVADIDKNPEVHISCGVENIEECEAYLQIQGLAEVSEDEEEKRALWNDELKRYFKGPKDPDYAVIIVKPYRIEYFSMENMGKPDVWKG